MTVQFRSVATLTAFVLFALSLTLMFAPDRVVVDWGIEVTLAIEEGVQNSFVIAPAHAEIMRFSQR